MPQKEANRVIQTPWLTSTFIQSSTYGYTVRIDSKDALSVQHDCRACALCATEERVRVCAEEFPVQFFYGAAGLQRFSLRM